MTPNSMNRPDLNAETLARVKAAAKHATAATAKAKPTIREVPTVFRGGVIKWEWFRRFSFRERLAILFGCNLVVMNGVACQHSAGKFQPVTMGRVSKEKTATDHMKQVCENIIEAQAPAGPVQQEPKA